MPKATGKQQDQPKSLRERRRTRRLALTFPIEVVGFERSGRMYREQAVTSDVNEHGCRFDLLRELERGEIVAIQRLGRDGQPMGAGRALLFKVVWVEPSERGWSIGANKLQPQNIWNIAFPPETVFA